jgi:hypothetical protein
VQTPDPFAEVDFVGHLIVVDGTLKYGRRKLKAYTVLPDVCSSLSLVPFELKLPFAQCRNPRALQGL